MLFAHLPSYLKTKGLLRIFLLPYSFAGQGAAGGAAGLDAREDDDVSMGEAVPWPFSAQAQPFAGQVPGASPPPAPSATPRQQQLSAAGASAEQAASASAASATSDASAPAWGMNSPQSSASGAVASETGDAQQQQQPPPPPSHDVFLQDMLR